MIPWIQVYSNLTKHPKTYALADELKLSSKDASPNAVAAGMLVSLWLWAAQNATDGDLSKCSARAIADAAEYKKSPTAFVAALEKTKWLDAGGKLHDWDEYATLLNDLNERQREQTKKRVERHRARKKRDGNGDVTHECNVTGNVTKKDCNATDTPCNAPTIPNHTLPNHTIITDTVKKPVDGNVRNTAANPSAPPIKEIVDLYNALCPLLPRCTRLADVTGYMIADRWKQYGNLDSFRELFQKAQSSDFLAGKKNGWRANLDWLMTGDNMTKVLNDNYANVSNSGGCYMVNGERQLDEAEMEAIQRVLAQPVEEIGEDV